MRLAVLAAMGLAWSWTCVTARAADLVRVGYAAQSFSFDGSVEMGIQEGFFTRQGLTVQPTMFGGGAKLHTAMIAGAEDIGLAAGSDFAFLVKGSPEHVVYGVVNQPYSVGVSVVDPAIRAPDDLIGKRIGVTTQGSYTYWFASQLPRFLNWKPGQTAIPVSIGGSLANQMASLTTGQVDAVVGDIVLGLTLHKEGKGQLVLNASDVVKDVVTAMVFAHNDLMAQKPDVLQRFLVGLRQSIDFLVAHKDVTMALAIRLNKTDPEITARYIDITNPGWSMDGVITKAQLRGTAVAIQQAGLLDTVADLQKLYDPDFAPH
jgi:NitT/TauT family transport system substrate-binding protein